MVGVVAVSSFSPLLSDMIFIPWPEDSFRVRSLLKG